MDPVEDVSGSNAVKVCPFLAAALFAGAFFAASLFGLQFQDLATLHLALHVAELPKSAPLPAEASVTASLQREAGRGDVAMDTVAPRDAGEGETALVVVSFWWNESRPLQWTALRKVLRAAAEFPCHVDLLLVTNSEVPRAELVGVRVEQVVAPRPQCSATRVDDMCLPFDAIKALRERAWSCRECAPAAVGAGARSKEYTFYVYVESDVVIPASTFRFWRSHVESLYNRGYILTPFRVQGEVAPLTKDTVLTDCFIRARCLLTSAMRDTAAPTNEYDSLQDRVYIKPKMPYAACWLMTRRQFVDYMEGTEWDYEANHYRKKEIFPRESVVFGLLSDPRFAPNASKGKAVQDPNIVSSALTHVRLPVFHLFECSDPWVRSRQFRFDVFTRRVEKCAGNASCPAF